MNLFLYELKSSWKSLLIWIVSILGLLMFSMSMFPSFANNSTAVNEMLENFSPEMMRALGMDVIDFSKPMDYLAYMFQYILVAVGALGILTGSNIIAKEESDKTIEFLYSRPLSRIYIVKNKILAGIFTILITAFSFFTSTTTIMQFITDEIDYSKIAQLSAGMALFMIMVLSIGLFIGHFFIKSGKRMPVALGLLFFLYFASIMSDVSEQMKGLKYITPFKFFDAIGIIKEGLSAPYTIVSILLITASSVLVTLLYMNKDLYS